jgi:DNA helicase MCM8
MMVACAAVQARQLDSLIRLTEARARVDLREVATAADAEDVIDLMKFSMHDFFCDSVPFLHVPAKERGAKAEARRLMEALEAMKRTQGTDQVSVAEMTVLCDDLGLHALPVKDLVAGLNEAGELLKRGRDIYSF